MYARIHADTYMKTNVHTCVHERREVVFVHDILKHAQLQRVKKAQTNGVRISRQLLFKEEVSSFVVASCTEIVHVCMRMCVV